jgi:tripartite-type tricarboxylate transporter receptor subunit TctC
VPYKGSPQALQDLIAGRVQVMFDASAIPLVRSGQLRALAVASTQRWPQIPELPSMAEQGFPDFYVGGWFGMFVPTGTPKEIINRLNAESNRILRTPDFRSRITQAGLEVKGGTVEEAKAFVQSELAKWGAVVKASGARADD